MLSFAARMICRYDQRSNDAKMFRDPSGAYASAEKSAVRCTFLTYLFHKDRKIPVF